jgi:hypothetical protein
MRGAGEGYKLRAPGDQRAGRAGLVRTLRLPARRSTVTRTAIYYLNVMAGPIREWQFKNDPDHVWLF